ncbi:MAG: hypothetical protein ACRDYY_07980 [Acidimicrobiales bacterium]
MDQLARLIGVMRDSARETGRDPSAIAVTAGGASDPDGVRRLAELGVTRVVVPNLGGDPQRWKARLGSFADKVISAVG